jgi:protein HOOK3
LWRICAQQIADTSNPLRTRSKSEDALGEAELLSETQARQVEDLSRKLEELTPKAEQAIRLKDEMDEYRHAADRARKAENALEKYKKKLEESADLKRTIKVISEGDADSFMRFPDY